MPKNTHNDTLFLRVGRCTLLQQLCAEFANLPLDVLIGETAQCTRPLTQQHPERSTT
jgi:hypothetical protein